MTWGEEPNPFGLAQTNYFVGVGDVVRKVVGIEARHRAFPDNSGSRGGTGLDHDGAQEGLDGMRADIHPLCDVFVGQA